MTRNITTISLLAVSLLLAGGLLVWQSGWLSDGDEDDVAALRTPEASATPEPPTAPAFSGVCEATPLADGMPRGWPGHDPTYPEWYTDEDEDFWAAPFSLPAMNPDLPESEQRWFAGGVTPVNWFGAEQPVVVTATMLDGVESFTLDNRTSFFPQGESQITELRFPSAGCWQLSGRADDLELTITVEVAAIAERPDFVLARSGHEAVPFDVPESCAMTPWEGPADPGNRLLAMYWLNGDDAAIGHQTGALYAQQDVSFNISTEASSQVNLTARLISADETVEADVIEPPRGLPSATLAFPEAGCWELEVVGDVPLFTAVVYVFPAECAPESAAGSSTDECRPPDA